MKYERENTASLQREAVYVKRPEGLPEINFRVVQSLRNGETFLKVGV